MGPRTLTDHLRGLSRDHLVDLLDLRPDLTFPRPADLVEVANRSTTSTSIARALESLDAYQRLVAEAAAALTTPTSVTEIASLLESGPDDVARAIAALRDRALVW